jgi:hypothetical protein
VTRLPRRLAALAVVAVLLAPPAMAAAPPPLQRLTFHLGPTQGAPRAATNTTSCEVVAPVIQQCHSFPIVVGDTVTITVEFVPGSGGLGVAFWEHYATSAAGADLLDCTGLGVWGVEDPLGVVPRPPCHAVDPAITNDYVGISIHTHSFSFGYWKVTMEG